MQHQHPFPTYEIDAATQNSNIEIVLPDGSTIMVYVRQGESHIEVADPFGNQLVVRPWATNRLWIEVDQEVRRS